MKICLVLFLFVFNVLSPIKFTAYADERITYYAKITSSNVFFYKTMNEDDKLFEIPSSYFVLLTENANDEFYVAKYGDLIGFVKKNEVTPMDGTPLSPYATSYNCRITSMSGLPLKESTTFESDTVADLEFLENKIYYYGKKQGEEFFPNSTNVWLYCKISSNNGNKFGYIFSYYCDFVTNVKDNNEYFDEITETLNFTPIKTETITMSETLKAIIILAITIPALIVLYFFLTKKNGKKVKKSKRRKDYYELSENDLN